MSLIRKPGLSREAETPSIPTNRGHGRTAHLPAIRTAIRDSHQTGPASRGRQLGATALEYTLILALASVLAFAGFQLMGGSLDSLIGATSDAIAGSP